MTVPTPLQIALRQSRARPTVVSGSIAGVGGGIAEFYQAVYNGGENTPNSATSISIQNTGSGASQNVQPTIVSFLPLIRAA